MDERTRNLSDDSLNLFENISSSTDSYRCMLDINSEILFYSMGYPTI